MSGLFNELRAVLLVGVHYEFRTGHLTGNQLKHFESAQSDFDCFLGPNAKQSFVPRRTALGTASGDERSAGCRILETSRKADLHQISNAGAGERVSYEPLPDQKTTNRNGAHAVLKRTTN